MSTDTIELDDQEWAAARDAIAQRFLSINAADFTRRYQAGDYNADREPDFLMEILAYFPELD